jgi:sugar phosphate isomerase/epimerase
MLTKVEGAGYDGVEIGIPADPAARRELRALLDECQLDVIAHQYQATGETFDDYLRSFEQWIEIAASFEPLLVNSHTGRDCWTREQNLRLVDSAQCAAQRHGIPVLHESHRRHFLYSAPQAMEYFRRAPNLMITADLAHWVCVAESLLVGHEAALEEAIRRAGHIHARVGFAEGPQVPDPFLPIWSHELTVFSEWWLRIAQRFRSEGKECLTVTLEYGPPPYGWVSLSSGEPLRDLFEMNLRMKDYLHTHFQNNLDLQP